MDLKKESIITTEDVMKYLNRFKDLDYNNPSSIRILFSVFLKAVIITDDDDIIVICNNSDKQKNEPFNAKEFVFNLTGGAEGNRTPVYNLIPVNFYMLSFINNFNNINNKAN